MHWVPLRLLSRSFRHTSEDEETELEGWKTPSGSWERCGEGGREANQNPLLSSLPQDPAPAKASGIPGGPRSTLGADNGLLDQLLKARSAAAPDVLLGAFQLPPAQHPRTPPTPRPARLSVQEHCRGIQGSPAGESRACGRRPGHQAGLQHLLCDSWGS